MGKLKLKGRKIRQQLRRNRKGEAVLDGVKPKPGMWLIHPERKRCYGSVRRVKHTGDVVVLGTTECKHAGALLYEGGYRYSPERPSGEGWQFFVQLMWRDEAPASWGVPS